MYVPYITYVMSFNTICMLYMRVYVCCVMCMLRIYVWYASTVCVRVMYVGYVRYAIHVWTLGVCVCMLGRVCRFCMHLLIAFFVCVSVR